MTGLYMEKGLYLTIRECHQAPNPGPLESGFSLDRAYRATGVYNASETSEAYFILINDRNEVWFISNRHLRFYCIDAESSVGWFPLNKNSIALEKVF